MASLIRRGLLAGACGGAAMGTALLYLGESLIDAAAALERPHEAIVGSLVQSAGGVFGAVLLGTCYGVVYAVVFAAARHRLPGRSDRVRAAALATASFATLFLAPSIKYGASLPGSADPLTVGERTRLYVIAVVWSILAALLVWRLVRSAYERGLADHFVGPGLIVVWAVVVVMGLGLMPPAETVELPGGLAPRFRIATGIGSFVFWAVVATVFGALCVRADRQADRRSSGFAGNARWHG